MSVDDIVRILAANGGVIISAEGQTVSDLVRISATASTYENKVVIRNAGALRTDELVRIASAGRGHTILEL